MEPQRIIFWHKTHKTHKNVVKAKVNVVLRFNYNDLCGFDIALHSARQDKKN